MSLLCASRIQTGKYWPESETQIIMRSMNLEREMILQSLRESKPALARRFSLWRLALFSSFARGDATSESDIDILVEVEPSMNQA